MLKVSDLVTNASQETRGQHVPSQGQIVDKTTGLATQASGISNVTSADIRQIKLNYLQLNKRSTNSNQTAQHTHNKF